LRDTLAPSFSSTKALASTLIHVLRDRGLLEYDDPVAKHWPEFGANGKGGITLRHVLAYQSGLYHIRQMIDHADRMLDWDHMVHVIERARPSHAPGKRTGYHGLTYGFLLGEIAQRVGGRSFADLVAEEIAGPLGADGMLVGVPPAELHSTAQLLQPPWSLLGRQVAVPAAMGERAREGAERLRCALQRVGIELDLGSMLDALSPRGVSAYDFGSHEALRASSPAAAALFTARSLARMYAALAGGGEIDRVRLLSRETFERATEPQAVPAGRSVFPFEMRWRLGYHGVFTSRGALRGAFGHFGVGGSGGWADPRRELAVGLIVNSGLGAPFGDLRIARIGGAVLQCADAVERRGSHAEPGGSADLLHVASAAAR